MDEGGPIRDDAGAETDAAGREKEKAALDLVATLDLAPVMVRDFDGTIRTWTTGLSELYGYQSTDTIGRCSHELLRTVFPKPRAEIEADLLRCGRWRGELRHRHKDGSDVIVASLWTLRRGQADKDCVVEVNNDVTEARHFEADQLRLAAIVESSGDAIVAKSLDGTITSWNSAAEQMLGYSAAEIVGCRIAVLAPPGLENDIPRILERTRNGEVAERYETRHRRKDGTMIDVSVTVSPIRDASGAIVGASKIARDITAHKRSEAALRTAEERFRAIFEQAAVGIAEVALDGRWIAVNQRLCEITGYSRKELLRLTFQDITHAEDLDLDLGHVRRLLAGESESYQIEKRYITRLGARVWGLLTVALVRDDKGGPAYFISVIEDVSARKQAEQALRESEQRFRILLESSPQMMWVNRFDGAAEYFNAACRDYLGDALSRPGAAWMEAVHPDDRAAMVEARVQAIAVGRAYQLEYRLRRALDGAFRWHAARIAPLERDGAIQAWVGTAADIDDLRHTTVLLEERVQERTRRLAEANAELEAFSYSVAHDLRAPLRSMRGFSQALLEDYADRLDDTGRDFANRIIGGADRLDDLISDLLAYSRLAREEIRPERLDIGDMIRQVLDQIRSAIVERHAEVVIEGPLPFVRGQRSILQQVALNLISNAIKFVAPGVPPHVRISARGEGGMVRVCVEDNGIGFDPKHAERVFKVFERLHGTGSTYLGTGIGLAIVRKGIERLGGRVGVTTAPDQGSCFWFELPSAGA